MYEQAVIEIPIPPGEQGPVEWAESKYVLFDEHNRAVAYVLECSSCGKHVTVTEREYAANESTFCGDCVRRQH